MLNAIGNVVTARTSLGMLGTETALQRYQFPHSCVPLTHHHILGGGWDHPSLPAASTAQFCSKGLGKVVLSGSTGSLSMG